MSCDRYQELFSAVIDGELTDSEEGQLRSHLAECSACRAKLETMRQENDLLSSSAMPRQPSGLRAKVKERIGLREYAGELEPWCFGHFRHRRAVPIRSDAKNLPYGGVMGPWGRA